MSKVCGIIEARRLMGLVAATVVLMAASPLMGGTNVEAAEVGSGLAGTAALTSEAAEVAEATEATEAAEATEAVGLTPGTVEVVASTSWTAAIARAAGAARVTVLAPAELRHPPEYDFRASDIAKVAGSAIVVWGGYEPFIQRLIQAAEVPEERVVQISTVNTPDSLVAQSRLLSERLGTVEAQQAWEQEFERFAADLRSRAGAARAGETRVLVHFHQQGLAEWLGYNVVGVFGPEELSPARVVELTQLKPDLIIDNYHNPQAQAIQEIAGCRRVELRNFPETETDTIETLLLDNARKLGLLGDRPAHF